MKNLSIEKFKYEQLNKIFYGTIIYFVLIWFVSISFSALGLIGPPEAILSGHLFDMQQLKGTFFHSTDESLLPILMSMVIQAAAVVHFEKASTKADSRRMSEVITTSMTGLTLLTMVGLVVSGLPGIVSKQGLFFAVLLVVFVSFLVAVSLTSLEYDPIRAKIEENEKLVEKYKTVEEKYRKILGYSISKSGRDDDLYAFKAHRLGTPRQRIVAYYLVLILGAITFTAIGYFIDWPRSYKLSWQIQATLFVLDFVSALCIAVFEAENQLFDDADIILSVKGSMAAMGSRLCVLFQTFTSKLGIICLILSTVSVTFVFSVNKGFMLSFLIPLMLAVSTIIFFWCDARNGRKAVEANEPDSVELQNADVPMKLSGKFYVTAKLLVVSNRIKDLNQHIEEDKRRKPNTDNGNDDQ
ncbi:MAG: hypothetical protein LKJ44_04220 [Bifidobacteriaceae bacterium]|jgi:hypothetical protein|nr:hypothetical protein [Bifidobacteriaceae bacterium]MCI1978903.1 hypothetical protein [Bifidobacteriaceae bacterium]